MQGSDTYRTIRSVSSGLYKEKGSRFQATAYPVSSEEEIKQIIELIRKEYHEAKHHCYAWIIGMNNEKWRASDDGEPSGTGGRPILGQIRSSELTNILVIVSRYFGGTLLGVSGLINAYRSAAASALSAAEITEEIVRESFEIVFPYSSMNDVMKIVKEEDVVLSSQEFDLECKMVADVRISVAERILERLSRIEGLSFRSVTQEHPLD